MVFGRLTGRVHRIRRVAEMTEIAAMTETLAPETAGTAKGSTAETAGTGFGLKGIRERAEQLKGRASYRMAPNEGFTLDVELPA